MTIQLNFVYFTVMIYVFAALPLKTNPQKITVFSRVDYEGDQETIDISKCSNVSPDLAHRVKSVNTSGNCARLYSDWNCTGKYSIELYPRSPSSNILTFWEFTYQTASVGPCRDPCDIEVTGENKPEDVNVIVMYSETWSKGEKAVLAVKGCTLIPFEWVSKVESVDTNGTCFQLYNNKECHTEGENIDSIELRKETPLHSAIKESWGWAFPETRAVSHCRYKCKSGRRIEENKIKSLNPVDYSSSTMKPEVNTQLINVFTEEDYKGDQETVDVSHCSNLSPGMMRKVKSVDTGGNCARLYSDKDCRGKSIELYQRSPKHSWLLNWDFSELTVSTGPCRDACDIKVTGEITQGKKSDIVIYSEPWWEGEKLKLTVRGCTVIPKDFTDRLASVKTNGTCFQLYNNYYCQPEGKNVDSIELRKGTPNHFDIKSKFGWGLSEARAVSHCRFKCKSSGRIKNDLIQFSPKNYSSTSASTSAYKFVATQDQEQTSLKVTVNNADLINDG